MCPAFPGFKKYCFFYLMLKNVFLILKLRKPVICFKHSFIMPNCFLFVFCGFVVFFFTPTFLMRYSLAVYGETIFL